MTRLGSSRPDGALGSLLAWDPVRQERAWEVPLDGLWQAGTLTTAGNLVFHGRSDGHLAAHDATTGAELWRFNVGSGISAPPITYAVGGRQYVALLVGWGGAMAGVGGRLTAAHGWSYGVHPRRLIAFSLDGDARVAGLTAAAGAGTRRGATLRDRCGPRAAGRRGVRRACAVRATAAGAVSSGMAPDPAGVGRGCCRRQHSPRSCAAGAARGACPTTRS